MAGVSAREQYVRVRRAQRRRRLGRLVGLAGAAGLLADFLLQGDRVALAAGLVVGTGVLFVRPDKDPERWLRGADGEEQTAALLDALSPRRWHVLHDRAVPGLALNIDHLVIGPTGVWVVDTKASRAPLRARRGRVEAGGHPIDPSSAAWEAELVSERLGVPVTPIVAVHGAGLGRRGRRSAGVRIVPARSLVRRVRRGRHVLSRAAVRQLTAHADVVLVPR